METLNNYYEKFMLETRMKCEWYEEDAPAHKAVTDPTGAKAGVVARRFWNNSRVVR